MGEKRDINTEESVKIITEAINNKLTGIESMDFSHEFNAVPRISITLISYDKKLVELLQQVARQNLKP